MLLPPVAGCDAAEASPPRTTPTVGQAIPLLTHIPCYSAATASSHHSRTSEHSYSSSCGHPLPRLPRLRVIPFLGLAVVHRYGALGAAWSMCSTTDFHQKSTVRGEADSWVHAAARKYLIITRKIIIPPPDSRDPPDGTPYLAKKCFPLTAGTHRTGHRISRKNVPPVVSSDPPEVPLYYAQKMNTPLASWDPPWWEADLWAY